MPDAHKVERLINLELVDMRVVGSCSACGKEHREGLDVNGSREDICEADAVIKR